MNAYNKLFGTGPRGLFISLVLFALFFWVEDNFSNYTIFNNNSLRLIVFIFSILLTLSLVIWSIKSLPPVDRGEKLITTGAFKYFRHPLYAAVLLFFNFGLAIYLNNWIFIFWAILQFPVWQWNVQGEEIMMQKIFGNHYLEYCKSTGKFFPRIK